MSQTLECDVIARDKNVIKGGIMTLRHYDMRRYRNNATLSTRAINSSAT
jgi:hypothetical protein